MTGTQRLDKWLWFARFFKTRSLAAAAVTAGHVRVNGTRVEKPGAALRAGDVLTFALGKRVLTVRMIAAGERRGPAAEAQTLYEDVANRPAPAEPSRWPPPNAARVALVRGKEERGAMNKKQRRDFEAVRTRNGTPEGDES